MKWWSLSLWRLDSRDRPRSPPPAPPHPSMESRPGGAELMKLMDLRRLGRDGEVEGCVTALWMKLKGRETVVFKRDGSDMIGDWPRRRLLGGAERRRRVNLDKRWQTYEGYMAGSRGLFRLHLRYSFTSNQTFRRLNVKAHFICFPERPMKEGWHIALSYTR